MSNTSSAVPEPVAAQALVDDTNLVEPHIPAMSDHDYSMADRQLQALFDNVDRAIVGWRPEPGEKVGGRLVEIQDASGRYGDYKLLVIETPTGRFIGVHAFHDVVKKQVKSMIDNGNMRPGYMIAVKYEGESEVDTSKPVRYGPDGRPFSPANLYRISCAPPQQTR